MEDDIELISFLEWYLGIGESINHNLPSVFGASELTPRLVIMGNFNASPPAVESSADAWNREIKQVEANV